MAISCACNTFLNQKHTERRRLRVGPLPDELELVADPSAREPHAAVEAGEVFVAMRDWLEAHQRTHVAMEVTRVIWQPVLHVVEDAFELMLVNARHVKQVPGRKTDVSDAAWLTSSASPAGQCSTTHHRRNLPRPRRRLLPAPAVISHQVNCSV